MTTPKNTWISVKDAMPEIDSKVEVELNDSSFVTCEYRNEWVECDGWESLKTDFYFENDEPVYNVVKWKYIP